MELINLNNAYAPIEHTHIDDVDGSAYPEPWLKNLLDTKPGTQHTHPASRGAIVNLTSGLAANTWVNFYVANTLTRYKVFVVKVRLECGAANYPYSGCAVFLVATTSCNATNTIYTAQMMLHNGNSIAVEIRASGGNQNTPAFDFRFPSQAIPINSQVICEFLELF